MLRLTFIFVIFLGLGQTWILAQPTPMAKPEDLGLRIPVGKTPFEVHDRSVLVPADGDAWADPVVAKVYLEVGSHYVVIMPDGALRSIDKRQTTETDREFKPLTKDQLGKKLKQQFRGFKTYATRRYLCVYNTSDEFCERKAKILETMYPMLVSYFKRQKLKPVDPDTLLVVVMFRNKTQFQKYREGMPDSMLAYYNSVNNRVFMYQHSDIADDAPLIAAKQSTSTIAHEGVHQILHNIGVQKRLSSWPLWLSEGVAEYFSPTSVGVRSKWKGVGRPNELRMRDLFIYLNNKGRVGDGSILNRVVTAEKLNSTDYAISWALVHFLTTKHKKEFFAYLREVSSGLPLEPPAEELVRFVEHFGTDLQKLERDMIKHIRSLPYTDPVANQLYYLITLKVGKKKYATVTSSVKHGQIRMDMLKKVPVKDRSKAVFDVGKFRNRRAALITMKAFLN